MTGMKKKPVSLYLHFPFCVRKCRYCDFLSFPSDEDTRESYINRLIEEIKERSLLYNKYKVTTIFLGGGTPSLMTSSQINKLFDAIRSNFDVRTDAEITIECNPGTADYEKLQAFRESGINRISFGLQSMNNEELHYLGRIHSREDFIKIYRDARRAGFNNINIDLMSALPGQTLSSYLNTLSQVIALEPEHISAYSLIIEEGTEFAKIYDMEESFHYENHNGKNEEGREDILPLPDEDSERAMYHQTKVKLKEAGYERYEISNYAKKGYECRHNLTYWYRRDYLGLGLGASSMVSNRRFSNTSDLSIYMYDFSYADVEVINREEELSETFILGLRCMEGLDLESIRAEFGSEYCTEYDKLIEKYVSQGFLKLSDDRLSFTEEGIDVSNWILSDFIN